MPDYTTNSQDESRQVIYIAPCPGTALGVSGDDDINFFDLLGVLWARKWFMLGFSLFVNLPVLYFILYVMPDTFMAQATLIQTGSGDSKLRGITSLASSLPIPIGLSGGGDNHLMVFLQSTDLQFKLIEKYNLLPRLYPNAWDPEKNTWRADEPKSIPSTVRAIQTQMLKVGYSVSQDKKTNLITITWEDQDPVYAAEMLKRIIAELDYYLVHDYISDARRERAFVEKQLFDSTRDLEYWEQQVPSSELTLAKIKREIMAGTTVYAELRKQVELAKFAEEKEVVNFKVLDQPYVPEIRHKPKRTQICILTLVFSLVAAILIVFIQRAVGAARLSPDNLRTNGGDH